MTRLFAVMNRRGPRWDPGKKMEEQPHWRAHADFMNGLHAAGHVLLGGPLVDTPDVLLIMRAQSEAEVTALLAPDIWVVTELLQLGSVKPWELRLGKLPSSK